VVKIWPIVALFGEWDRRRLVRAIGAVAAVTALTFLVAAILFGDQSGFFANQDVRGLQREAVGASPGTCSGASPNANPKSCSAAAAPSSAATRRKPWW
jgi:hypothetical protein